jgi:WD40 repeat protein
MTLRVWNMDTGSAVHDLRGHTDCVRCLTVSRPDADNPFLVSGADDRCIKIWSLLKGHILQSLVGHTASITGLRIATEYSFPVLVSSGQDKSIRLWNLRSAEFMFQMVGHDASVNAIAVSRSGVPLIASGGSDKLVKVWDLNTGRLLRRLRGHESKVTCVDLSPDPSCASPMMVSGDASGRIVVWDLKKMSKMYVLQEGSDPLDSSSSSHWFSSKSEEESLAGRPSQTRGEVLSVAISFGSSPLIVTASWNMPVKMWDAKSGGLVRIFDGASSCANAVVFCRDAVGPLIAVGTTDAEAFIVSPHDDFLKVSRSTGSLEEITMETSLVLVGLYISCLRLDRSLGDGEDHEVLEIGSKHDNRLLCTVFYCMIRFGLINPQFFLANVDIVGAVIRRVLGEIDLLLLDPMVGCTALQFLLEHRVCIGAAQDWSRMEKNQSRVMLFLADKNQSSETLECILSAIVPDQTDGWEFLLSHDEFPDIFVNLFSRSPRTHKKVINCISMDIQRWTEDERSTCFHRKCLPCLNSGFDCFVFSWRICCSATACTRRRSRFTCLSRSRTTELRRCPGGATCSLILPGCTATE